MVPLAMHLSPLSARSLCACVLVVLKEAIAAGAEGDTNMRQQLLLQSLQSSCASQHEIEEADP